MSNKFNRRGGSRVFKWVSIGLIIAFLVAGVHLVIGENGVIQVKRLERERIALGVKKAELIEKKADYQERIDMLESDPAAIEREIRRQLGYVRSDETVFFLNSGAVGSP
jgi:cell division protein FtsB